MDALFFLVGATASGKTEVALEIARIVPVEIASLDSMSVYRGMDIGTAKPTPVQRRQVRHHLIDLVSPDASFSVGAYTRAAEQAIAEIRGRGKRPLFVGGTPLYLKAMTAGLFDGPAADWDFRRQLHARAEREGTHVLHDELAEVDPVTAARLHPNDLKRIVRGLEVYHKTGRPITELQRQWSTPAEDRPAVIAGIARDRKELYRRIDVRVDRMFASGLVDEVRRLLDTYGELSREAAQALGYKEVLRHLAGEIDLEQSIALVKRNTRRMAKRQLTWFRSFGEIRWLSMDEETSASGVAAEIAAYPEIGG